MAFKIYYDDGSVIKSWEIQPDEPRDGQGLPNKTRSFIPPRGIIGIIQDDTSVGWTILTGYDYYILRERVWIGANYHQLLDILIEANVLILDKKGMRLFTGKKWRDADSVLIKNYIDETGYILTGRMTSGKHQEDLLQQAAYDPEFPPKSRWYLNEPTIALRAPGVSRDLDETYRGM